MNYQFLVPSVPFQLIPNNYFSDIVMLLHLKHLFAAHMIFWDFYV
jgi:hypothetical protein